MKHIFYIPKIRQGGLEKVFSKYLSHIVDCKDLYLVCDSQSEKYIRSLGYRLENKNLFFLPNQRHLRIFFLMFLVVFKWRNHIIHAVQLDALKPLLFIGAFFKIFIIYHERTYVFPEVLQKYKNLLILNKENIKAVTVNSEGQNFFYQNIFGNDKIFRLYNPIISPLLCRARQQRRKLTNSNSDIINVICCGRLDGQKNISFIVDNWTYIKSKLPKFHFHIYLDENSICKVKSSKGLYFHKFNASDFTYLTDKHIGVICTNYEGFSTQMFEYGYVGMPILSSSHKYGLEEMEEKFEIKTYTNNDVDELINGLIKIKNEKQYYFEIKNDNWFNKFDELQSNKDFLAFLDHVSWK